MIATNSYRLLLSERYRQRRTTARALDISPKEMNLLFKSSRSTTGSQERHSDSADEVKAEVDAWNVQGSTRPLGFARLALLDDHEGTFTLAHHGYFRRRNFSQATGAKVAVAR